MSMREIIPRVFKNLGKFPSIQIPFLAVFINSIAKSSKGKRKIRTGSSPLRKKKRRENNVESNLTSIEKMPNVVRILYYTLSIRRDKSAWRECNFFAHERIRTSDHSFPPFLPEFPRLCVSVMIFNRATFHDEEATESLGNAMKSNRESHFFFSLFFFLNPRDTTMINIDNFILIFCYHLFQLLYGIIRISLYFLLSLN